jgi:hypothetical protein
MRNLTKLVNCGSKIFIYDFKSRRRSKHFGFEKDSLKEKVIALERILLTNFSDDSHFATFCLRIPLHEYDQALNKLHLFLEHLKKSSGNQEVRYLAVTEFPTDVDDKAAYIHLVTDIEITDLTISLETEMSEVEEEEYFEEVWGDETYVNVSSLEDLLITLTSVYQQTLVSKNHKESHLWLSNKLKQPIILWNKEAETFIVEHKILEYPIHKSTEVFDNRISGYVTINEYSF